MKNKEEEEMGVGVRHNVRPLGGAIKSRIRNKGGENQVREGARKDGGFIVD